jgi:type V secretory pathway adhesin AidA
VLSLTGTASAWAGCDVSTPASGQTVTCTAEAPNPQFTPVRIAPGVGAVTINVLAGAQLETAGGNVIQVDPGAGLTSVNNAGSLRATSGPFAGFQAQSQSTLSNAASGSIQSLTSLAVSMFGGTVINDGTIVSGADYGVFFFGDADGTLVNRGNISGVGGGVSFGGGNDVMEMLGGSVGFVRQQAGDDSLLISGGTLAAVDQGDGADSLQISDGVVTGTVQQGNGVDTFTMTGGSIGALLQGDAYDRFLMRGGRIVGAFDDGDYAEMRGGRIGRVNMKLDNNVFLMSGGSIDGNLVAGFGNDTIVLTDGYIGGNISVSGGSDSVRISGGTVRGEVRLSAGNDVFEWDGGGVVYGAIDLGEDDDTARLSNLNQGHLGAVPVFDGGTGVDVLQLNNVKTTGVARFQQWEAVQLANDSQLTFDGDLVLGDTNSATGTLDIDGSSALFAGNGVDTAVRAAAEGALVTVRNSGRIDLTQGGSGAGDTFTITGNYQGQGGGLYLRTVLADDASASDRLAVSGGSISGTTGLGIVNVGGGGAATTLDGILVVQALNGATSSADAFALFSPVAAGAYEYFLFKGGVSTGTGENWYLRSTLVNGSTIAAVGDTPGDTTPAPPEDLGPAPVPLPAAPSPDLPENPDPLAAEPAPPPEPEAPLVAGAPVVAAQPGVPTTTAPLPGTGAPPPTPGARAAEGAVVPLYRVETAAYAVVPPLLRDVSRASLGSYHERQGEQRLQQTGRALRAAWGRLIGQSTEQHWGGDARTGFDGDLLGLQAGLALWIHQGQSTRQQWGVLIGRVRASGTTSGLALGWDNVQVGQTRLDDEHAGLYWTLTGERGGYVDAVVLQSRYDGRAMSSRGLGIALDGDGTSASVEVGKPLVRFGDSAWWLEPQLQLIWQRGALDPQRDPFATVDFETANVWTGRVGVRVTGGDGLAEQGWQPYFKFNYWQGQRGEDRVRFNQDLIRTGYGGRWIEVGAGVAGQFAPGVSAYAVIDYSREVGDAVDRERRTIEGNVGLRLAW